MDLPTTVAFYGNFANIMMGVGMLLMGLTRLWAKRRLPATLPEPVSVELAAMEAVAEIHRSAFETHRAMIIAACEALSERPSDEE